MTRPIWQRTSPQLAAALKLERVYIVGHDIGGMVAYAFVCRYPQAARGAMILDVLFPGIEGWDQIEGHPAMWHVRFMQVPGLAEKLVAGRPADPLGYFFNFGKFTPSDVAHFVKAYATPAQLHAVFEMYRAFPANAQFNAAQRGPNDVPLLLAAGDGSPFAQLVPGMAEGLRANGCSHVATGFIRGAVHYLVEDQPRGGGRSHRAIRIAACAVTGRVERTGPASGRAVLVSHLANRRGGPQHHGTSGEDSRTISGYKRHIDFGIQ